jgi:hypothetical protein
MRSQKVLVGVTVLNVLLVAAAWFGVVGVGASSAQSSSGGVLQASGFDLLNDDGQVVAQLYTGEEGTGQLRLRGADGVVRVKLGVSIDGLGAGLALFQGVDPVPGVLIGTTGDGTRIKLADTLGEVPEERVLKP